MGEPQYCVTSRNIHTCIACKNFEEKEKINPHRDCDGDSTCETINNIFSRERNCWPYCVANRQNILV